VKPAPTCQGAAGRLFHGLVRPPLEPF
jgi:hypothetical protein